jgi:hypothetical protein
LGTNIGIYVSLRDPEVFMKKSNGKLKTEAQDIFLNPITISSSCKCKFVVCPIVDEERNESYLFANRLNELAHLCIKFMPEAYAQSTVILCLV